MAAQVALRRQQAREETEARDLSRQIQIDELVKTLQERDGLTYTAALQCVAAQQQQSTILPENQTLRAACNKTNQTSDSEAANSKPSKVAQCK